VSHPSDETTAHPSEEDLALLALGESLPQVDEHVGSCPLCEHELVALESTVNAARGADLAALPPPPPSVWVRVSEELGLAEEPAGRGAAVAALPARGRWRRRALAAGGALTAAAAGIALVTTLGGTEPAGGAATLEALGDVEARGTVQLARASDPPSLLVDTEGLPPPDGVYEVWLLDLDNDRIVTLGTLDETGRGWLSVPDDVVLEEFPVVDVSIEPDDGDPTHSGNSVLRGDVPT
jgi:anti-sigma-K factor RskA